MHFVVILQHIYVIRALTLLVLQRDDQYSAVMDALNKVVETNKKELLETVAKRKMSELAATKAAKLSNKKEPNKPKPNY